MQLQRYKKHDTTDSLCTSFFAQAALQVHFYNFGSAGIRLFTGPRSSLPAGSGNRAAAVSTGPESSPAGLKNSAPAVPEAASGNFRQESATRQAHPLQFFLLPCCTQSGIKFKACSCADLPLPTPLEEHGAGRQLFSKQT